MKLVDWIIVDMLAIRQGSLGHIRYVLKNELKWIPLYGFYFQQVEKLRRESRNIASVGSARLHLCSTKRSRRSPTARARNGTDSIDRSTGVVSHFP